VSTINFDISRLGEYDYYSPRLLCVQTDVGLVKFDIGNRFVQKEINKVWNVAESHKKPVKLIILKARRHGVSTYVQSRMFHKCHTISHRHGITIAADDKGCSYIHNMSHIFYEYLPTELRPAVRFKSKSQLYFDLPQRLVKSGRHGLKSSMRTVSCTDKAGLGTGQHFIHFSEYAFYRDADTVRTSVIPTAFKTPGTFIVLESTANGMTGQGEPFYQEWLRAVKGTSAFKPLFYSWLQHEDYRIVLTGSDEEEIRDTLDDEERYIVGSKGGTLEQLKWRREQIGLLGQGAGINTKTALENFHEQYPTTDTEAFIVSGKPVFDRAALRAYKERVKKPMWIGDIVGCMLESNIVGSLQIWEQPIDGEKYVASIDPSSGEPGDTDFGAIEVFRVLDRRDGGLVATQCAEWHGKMDTDIVAQYAVTLAKKYNNAIIAPEVCGYGHSVLKEIQKMDYWNIFKRRVVDSVNHKPTTKLGWKTDATTKPMLVSFARQCVENRKVGIKSSMLIHEMTIYVKDNMGSGTSAYGRGKDDLVDAFMINMLVTDIEYGDSHVDSVGVLENKIESKITKLAEKKDKLHYDTWDGRKKNKGHWLNL